MRIIGTEAIGGRWFATVEWRVWGFLWRRRATIVQFTKSFSRSKWYFADSGRPCYENACLNRQFTVIRDKEEHLERLLEQEERPRRLKAVK